jgi:DHA2 family multidrug resistance protein
MALATAFAAPRKAAGPLTGLPLLVAAITIGAGNFMVVLDSTITNVSVPNIAGALGVSANQG